jgi:hypothetical protein
MPAHEPRSASTGSSRPPARRRARSKIAWKVDDIDATVHELPSRGVGFEQHDLPGLRTADGIAEIHGNYPSEGVPLNIIQRQLGHANLGTTSISPQGIDPEEIIAAVRTRAPMMSASAGLRL